MKRQRRKTKRKDGVLHLSCTPRKRTTESVVRRRDLDRASSNERVPLFRVSVTLTFLFLYFVVRAKKPCGSHPQKLVNAVLSSMNVPLVRWGSGGAHHAFRSSEPCAVPTRADSAYSDWLF